jgi:hypothetical protein
MRICANLGGIIDLQYHRRRRKLEDPVLSPNILFMKQQNFTELNYGLYFNKYPMVGGLWFRQSIGSSGIPANADAFIALVGFQTTVVKIGYSYDITISKLSSATAGAHEVSFIMQFDCRPKKRRIRAINCPVF